ncbi:VWA domain-containing protein [Prosthecobacter fluviatilis]|uniref:VWA domain-containing protein n=1 Tax=Prosthecobacter fluviatilis TaxID=445931 RepID=A0ABW0KKT5_9BACT
MRYALASLALLLPAGLNAADDAAAVLKDLVKNVRAGRQEALAPLQELHAQRLAGEAVLSLVNDRRTGLGIKLRLAEIVAAWPAGEGRRTLADWLARHPGCDGDALLFFASAHLPETRSFFWGLLSQPKGPLATAKEPVRLALAARALGAFPDHPDPVVARVAALLDAACPHVMRACAAEALGGMRSPVALQALLPWLNDDAIGQSVHASLFQLTGQDFADDAEKWKAWLAEQGRSLPWKMLPRSDYAEYLKLQKLLKPLEDDPAAMAAMASFYGVEFRGKGALFILDVSGSMNADGRIGKLRGQMSNLLTALQNKPSRLRYGILTFGEDVTPCFSGRGMALNDEKNHRQAVSFVDRLEARGGTPMCEAFTHALTRILPEGGIDSIYFLSDGQPSDGTPAMVLDLAQRIHAEYRVRIHCISIGEETPPGSAEPSLLRQIAEACEGTFTVPP